MLPEIPADVREWLLEVFGACNDHVAGRLTVLPTVHEQSLDMSLIERLASFGAPQRFGSNWVVQVRAYYEGGRRHFRTWEVADIGLIVIFRRPGAEPIRKLALLQSKRLYPIEEASAERDEMGPHFDVYGSAYEYPPLESFEELREFTVGDKSHYRALQKGDAQFVSMGRYERDTKIPVYYLLYNPLVIPLVVTIPVSGGPGAGVRRDVGCRVLPATEVRRIMRRWRKGRSPTFGEVTTKALTPFDQPPFVGGWPLEHFVVDTVLRCNAGYRSTGPDDLSFFRVINLRAAPIAAAVSILFDVPGEGPLE